jgi:hypothetical protein
LAEGSAGTVPTTAGLLSVLAEQRGLTSTEHLAGWWFALRAHDLLIGRTPG